MPGVLVLCPAVVMRRQLEVDRAVVDADRRLVSRIEKGGGETGSSPARFIAETRAAGFRLEYEEFPFEWSHGRFFSVYRKMRGGGEVEEAGDDGGAGQGGDRIAAG